MTRALVCLVSLLFSLDAVAQFTNPFLGPPRDVAAYTKFLVPIYSERTVNGAFGSVWQTTLIVRNDGDTPLDVFPISNGCVSSSLCHLTVRRMPALGNERDAVLGQAGPQTYRFGSGQLGGGFLYVERARASQLSTHLEFVDVSRSPAAVVTLPVVPEEQFFDSTRSVLGVAISRTSRASLRIFDDRRVDSGRVAVRIHLSTVRQGPADDPRKYTRPLVDTVLTFGSPNPGNVTCGFAFGCPEVPYQPGLIAISDLLAAFPELEAAIDSPHGVRIEIAPLTSGLRFWPLVTVTDNATSHTTAYTVR